MEIKTLTITMQTMTTMTNNRQMFKRKAHLSLWLRIAKENEATKNPFLTKKYLPEVVLAEMIFHWDFSKLHHFQFSNIHFHVA